MLYGPRTNTTATQTFWACDCDDFGTLGSGGVLGVAVEFGGDPVAGSPFTGDTLATGNNYTGIVTATGLEPDTEYTYQMRLAGSDVTYATGTFRTLPEVGSDVDLLWVVCNQNFWPMAMASLVRESADAVYCSESTYLDGGSNINYTAAPASADGLSTGADLRTNNDPTGASDWSTTATGDTSENFNLFLNSYRLRQRFAMIGHTGELRARFLREFRRKLSCRFGIDNHEAFTSTGSNQPVPGQNQADGWMRAAWEYLFQGNPPNLDSPGGSQPTIDGTTVFPTYFREIVGDIEILFCDQVNYSAMASGPDAIRTLGAEQLAWLTDRIARSTTKFLVVFMPRSYQVGSTDWEHATGGILRALGDKYQTSVLVTGDLHRPMMRRFTKTSSSGVTLVNPVLEVGAGAAQHTAVKNKANMTGEVPLYTPLAADANHMAYSDAWTLAGQAACLWSVVRMKCREAGESLTVELANTLTLDVLHDEVLSAVEIEPHPTVGWDGTVFFSRGGALTGIPAAAKSWTLAVKLDATNFGATRRPFGLVGTTPATDFLRFAISTAGALTVAASGEFVWPFTLTAPNGTIANGVENVIVIRFQTDGDETSLAEMHVNGALVDSDDTFAGNVPFAAMTDIFIGRDTSGSANPFIGHQNFFWFAASVDEDGALPHPALFGTGDKDYKLGDTGIVGGVAPLVFMRGDVDTYGTNLGTGGAFSQTGTLT